VELLLNMWLPSQALLFRVMCELLLSLATTVHEFIRLLLRDCPGYIIDFTDEDITKWFLFFFF
jgi:hypothetical protein